MVAKARAPRWRRAVFVVPILIGLLAFGLRVWQPGPVTVTTDEPIWLLRADGFRTAVKHGDFAHATAAGHVPNLDNATMPGVTTMWAATAGRGLVKIGESLGLNTEVHGPSVESPAVLRAGRAVVALWSALLIGLIVALGWALLGRVAGTVAGVLLATEPWFVGLGNMLHTDELLTLFSAVSMLGLIWALRYGRLRPDGTPDRATLTPPAWMLVGSGASAGLAVLTKLSALALVVPGVVIIVLIQSVPEVHLRGWKPVLAPRLFRRWARLGLRWTGSALVVFVALWPAMWVAPLAQIRDMWRSMGLAGEGHPQFFFGSVSNDPGVFYYPVAWAFRMTPWVLIGALAVTFACVVQLWRWSAQMWRRLRWSVPRQPLAGTVPLWLVLIGVPYALVISFSPAKVDRYVVALLPYLALAIGVVMANAARFAQRHSRARRLGWPLGVGAAVAIGVLTVTQAPYAISYTNRMLGGQQVAQHVIMLGWGEGTEAMGATIARREAGNCGQIVVAVAMRPNPGIRCGQLAERFPRSGHLSGVDYVVTYINLSQRGRLIWLEPALERQAALIDQVEIGGVPYAQLWHVR